MTAFIRRVEEIHIVSTGLSRPALTTYPRILSQKLKGLERQANFPPSSTAVIQSVIVILLSAIVQCLEKNLIWHVPKFVTPTEADNIL